MKNQSETALEGIIKTITFSNEETGFCVLKIETHDAVTPSLFSMDSSLVTVTGSMIEPKKGEKVTVYGHVSDHPKFGKQFQFNRYEKERPVTTEGLVDYLSSDLFTGVGRVSATIILEALGPKALEKIRDDASVLDGLKIPKALKKTLPDMLVEHQRYEILRVQLFKYGLTVKMVKSLIATYQDKALDVVEKDPYQLIQDVKGIGFERADVIAGKIGIDKEDPRRIRALYTYMFEKETVQKGHTHLEALTLLMAVDAKLKDDAIVLDEDDLRATLKTVIGAGLLMMDDAVVTRPIYLEAETFIAEKLNQLNQQKMPDLAPLRKALERYQTKAAITFTKEQESAIINAFQHGVYIITGGPGTGKTTIIKGLIEGFLEPFEASDIALLAPTGKAAKRIEEASGFKASTFHRFLKIRKDTFTPPESVPHKVIIIDEASMVDTVLFFTLLKSLKDVQLILVGDDAQLPSVSPGQIFKDLLHSSIAKTELKEVHRQAKGSSIIQLAQMIRSMTLDVKRLETGHDLILKPLLESQFYAGLDRMIQYYLDAGYRLFDISVILPVYAGKIGIDEVNRHIQNTFNPAPIKTSPPGHFKVGDKVHQLVNDYDKDVMNGDQGMITSIQEDMLSVQFDETEIHYPKKEFDQLKLAYAISVHKSQGSGFPVVIVPLFRTFRHMLSQSLIYTATTRAIQELVICGDLALLDAAATIVRPDRNTRLKEKMTNAKPSLSPYDFLNK